MVTIEITDKWVEIRDADDRANSVMAYVMADGTLTLESSGLPFGVRPEQVETWVVALRVLAARARKMAAAGAGREPTVTTETDES